MKFVGVPEAQWRQLEQIVLNSPTAIGVKMMPLMANLRSIFDVPEKDLERMKAEAKARQVEAEKKAVAEEPKEDPKA